MSLNRTSVMGRIGKDLELRRTQSGKAVTSFPIAVDRDGKDAGTDWFDVVAWERTAEFAAQYCAKGARWWWTVACRHETGPTRTAISAARSR